MDDALTCPAANQLDAFDLIAARVTHADRNCLPDRPQSGTITSHSWKWHTIRVHGAKDERAICPPCSAQIGADLDRREVNDIAVTRTYETLYIIDPNLTEEQVQAVTDKYSGIVTQTGGEIIAVERWDRRRLAYEVKGRREGMYILMYFHGEPAVAAEIDRVMKLSEDVFRHLITREENNQAEAAKERASRPAPPPVEVAPPAAPEAPAEEPEATAEVAEEAPEAEAEAPSAPEAVEAPVEEEVAATEEEPAQAEESTESTEEPATEE